jgi:SAM-dependent methyltransferase
MSAPPDRPNLNDMDDKLRLRLGATFDAVADGYEARPEYPDEIYALLVDRAGLGIGSRVAEIGPATGLATMRLLDLGATVTAVEPGPALAARLRERAAGRALEIVVGSFETAELPAAHFDLVAAATSFHWVDPALGLVKAAGHLRTGGWLALWWTVFGDPRGRPDPFEKAVGRILDEHAPQLHFDAFAGTTPHGLDTAARTAEIDATGKYGPVEQHVVEWEGHHSARGIRDLFATYSPFLALPEAKRSTTLDEIERVAREEFDDAVVRPYVTSLFLAQRERD